ncbi:MAG: hypothetical protein OMM_12881, partial [Candidatus Magnetoglobus multicellularis str. Araruama]
TDSSGKKKCIDTQIIKKEIDRLISINCGKFEHYVKLHKNRFHLLRHILIIQEKARFLFKDLHELVSKIGIALMISLMN